MPSLNNRQTSAAMRPALASAAKLVAPRYFRPRMTAAVLAASFISCDFAPEELKETTSIFVIAVAER